MTIPTPQSLYNANGGATPTAPFITIQLPRDPGLTDIYSQNGQYLSGQRWINTATNQEFYLDGYTSAGGTVLANWQPLSPVGTSIVETLTGTSGGAVGPDISGNINLQSSNMTIIGTPSTHSLNFSPGPNLWPVTPFVVGPVGQAGYQTIQSAINAANAAGLGVVVIQPGNYTENLILYNGINIMGLNFADAGGGVNIIGTHIPPTSGGFVFRNVSLTGTAAILSSVASGTAHLVISDAFISVTNGYTFDLPNWTGKLEIYDVNGFGGINDGFVNNTAGSTISAFSCSIGVGSLNPMIISGPMFTDSTDIYCPVNFISGAVLSDVRASFNGTVTCSGNSTGSFTISNFSTGSSIALTITSSQKITLNNVSIDSTATDVITGTGTVKLCSVIYVNSTGISGTITKDYTSEFETGTLKLNDADQGTLIATTGLVSALPMSNGQIIIGATGAAPAAASITPGSGITIIPGANSITISANGSLGGTLILNEQVFTSSATYIPTAGMVYCCVREVGGGAAGGGAATTNGTQLSAGSGGGSGEYAEGIFTMSIIGSSQNVIIGSGGIGSSGTTGGSGGPTSFGTLMSAFGGSGGLTIPATSVAAANAGGAGGTGGSGGSLRIPGTKGDGAITDRPGSFALAGRGGASILGTSGYGYAGLGLAATGYGGGGGGSENDVSSSAVVGGNGTSGVVIVTEYIVGGIASGIVVPAQGGTGIANPAAHTVPIAEGASNFNFVGPGTSGYVLMANGAGADPSFQAIPSISSPITIAQGGTNTNTMVNTDGVVYYDGSILNTTAVGTSAFVLTSNGTGNAPTFQSIPSTTFTWNTVVGTSQAVVVANGYFANNGSPVSMYLPSTAAVGTEVKFSDKGAGGGFLVIPAPGQTVNFLSQSATNPSYFSTSSIFAAMDLICETANTAWNVVNHEGTFGVASLPIVISISLGVDSSYFLKADGSCWGCGNNYIGQLGNLTTTSYSSPIAVVGNHSFIQISAGLSFTCGLKADGSCWAWGANGSGNLGNLTTTDYSSPIAVVGNHSFIQISPANDFACGLKANGSCWTWGFNGFGQLGNLTNTSYSSPIAVVGNHSFIKISSGADFVCGLKADGSCWSWGRNSSGNLGNLTTTDYSSPIAVVGNHSFIQISAGGKYFTCGLKADGSCWAWGNNDTGQLGNLTHTNSSSPIVVVGNHSFIKISSGFDFVCGLKADGSCWAWGDNTTGNLGNLTTTSYSSPVSVVGSNSFIQISSGYDFSCGLKAGGSSWTWGQNNYGQLGNLTTTNYSSPIAVVSF